MTPLVRRAGARHHLRHPGQVALALLGVALAVAVVVSMDLAMASARESFRASARTLAGRATHRIVGGPGGVPDAVFAAVRLEAGVRGSAPVVEGWISSPRAPGRALLLLGVDPFSEGALRPWLAGGPSGFDVSGLVTEPGAAVLAASTARELGVAPGEPLPVTVEGRTDTLRVLGVVEPRDESASRGLRNLVVIDVSGAQPLLGMEGRLDRIDLVLPEGTEEEALARIGAVLPPGAAVEAAGSRAGELAEMIRAFDLNLRALSLLALLFGAFLIYNSVTFSVVQRRELLGRLRAMGVTRREVFGLVLGEAAVLAVVGSALGLALGTLLGRGLLGLVVRTINDLYFVLPRDGLAVSPAVLAKGAALGVVATLAAAVPAAAEAVHAPPRATLTRSVLEERARTLVPRAAWAGCGLLAAGGILLLVPSRSVVLAFVALFGLVLGIALTAPRATVLLVRAAEKCFRRALGLLGTLAARGVAASLSRTGPAVVALVVAVSVTVGLGAMISSFRDTVSAWLRGTLQADVYVSLPGPGASRPSGTIEPGLARRIVGVEGVSGASLYRSVEVGGPDGGFRVVAVRLDPRSREGYRIVEGDPATALPALERGEAALLSEPLAFRRGLGVGDTVRLRTGAGPRTLPVSGIFRDYGSDRGVVVLDRALYERWWDDPGYTSLALFVEDGVEPDSVVSRVLGAAGEGRSLVVRSNRDLRAASLEVFDRTFAVTGVLRLLAFAVAFIGILGALMALQLERSRELGVLRALGMTPGQLWGVVTAQTGILGLVSGILALPAGALLAVVTVHVVNRRSFGWTLNLSFGGELVAETLGLALAGALLAGIFPAWKMARTSPARALREE